MLNADGFLHSSREYSTSDGTKHRGKGKLFACSMRFMLSSRHLILARRRLAGSFFIPSESEIERSNNNRKLQ